MTPLDTELISCCAVPGRSLLTKLLMAMGWLNEHSPRYRIRPAYWQREQSEPSRPAIKDPSKRDRAVASIGSMPTAGRSTSNKKPRAIHAQRVAVVKHSAISRLSPTGSRTAAPRTRAEASRKGHSDRRCRFPCCRHLDVLLVPTSNGAYWASSSLALPPWVVC